MKTMGTILKGAPSGCHSTRKEVLSVVSPSSKTAFQQTTKWSFFSRDSMFSEFGPQPRLVVELPHAFHSTIGGKMPLWKKRVTPCLFNYSKAHNHPFSSWVTISIARSIAADSSNEVISKPVTNLLTNQGTTERKLPSFWQQLVAYGHRLSENVWYSD